MLFNSYAFLFLFLPAILILTTAIERGFGRRAVLRFLTLASLFFYWQLAGQIALGLLLLSIVGNYLFAYAYRCQTARRLASRDATWRSPDRPEPVVARLFQIRQFFS